MKPRASKGRRATHKAILTGILGGLAILHVVAHEPDVAFYIARYEVAHRVIGPATRLGPTTGVLDAGQMAGPDVPVLLWGLVPGQTLDLLARVLRVEDAPHVVVAAQTLGRRLVVVAVRQGRTRG